MEKANHGDLEGCAVPGPHEKLTYKPEFVAAASHPSPTKAAVPAGYGGMGGIISSFNKYEQGVLVRHFETGATRSSDEGKPDFEGYISPLVQERYGEYMLKHSVQPDGTKRPSDNWQRGIPQDQLLKSAYRHFMDWWMIHRGHIGRETLEDSLCALIFNVSAYLHKLLLDRKYRSKG